MRYSVIFSPEYKIIISMHGPQFASQLICSQCKWKIVCVKCRAHLIPYKFDNSPNDNPYCFRKSYYYSHDGYPLLWYSFHFHFSVKYTKSSLLSLFWISLLLCLVLFRTFHFLSFSRALGIYLAQLFLNSIR